MNLDVLYSELTLKPAAKLALVVLDGLGDVATRQQGYLTPLEAALTPNLDALCKDSAQGRMYPIAPGITPGSGPGHLGLFGYDPLEYQVGRGVIEALGLGLDLQAGDVAARANFCTLDPNRIVTDRRAGRIPTEICEKLCAQLAAKVQRIGDIGVIIKPGKEHRFVVVFRGKGLEGPVTDADPNREGFPIPKVAPRDPRNAGQKKVARLVAEFYKAALPVLAREKPANGFLMRGIAHQPRIPLFEERYKLRPACLAVYPMYKGLAQLVGMKKLEGAADDSGAVPALPGRIRQLRFLLHPLQVHRQVRRRRQFCGQDQGRGGVRRRPADSAGQKARGAGHHRRPLDSLRHQGPLLASAAGPPALPL